MLLGALTALAGEMTEILLVTFGEITGIGETEFQRNLLYRLIRSMQELVGFDESAFADVIERSFAGDGFDAPEELCPAQLQHRAQVFDAQVRIREMILHNLFHPLGKGLVLSVHLDRLLHFVQLREDVALDLGLHLQLRTRR